MTDGRPGDPPPADVPSADVPPADVPAADSLPADLPRLGQDAVADDAVILDVRDAAQFAAGHAPGAINIPLAQLPERIDEVPTGAGPLPVTCGGGTKGKRATAYLRSHGRDVAELRGGMRGWIAQDRPTVTD